MGRGLDRKEVVRNLRILPSTEPANKINISENEWQNGWMDGWMNEYDEAVFDHLITLTCSDWLSFFSSLLNYFYVLPELFFFFFFLSISLKHRIFSYIFFQWYVGKAPVNISIEVDNVHSWFGKKIQYLNLSQLLLDLALIWIFTSQIWKLLLCHQWSSRGNVRLYVYNGPKSPSFKCIS